MAYTRPPAQKCRTDLAALEKNQKTKQQPFAPLPSNKPGTKISLTLADVTSSTSKSLLFLFHGYSKTENNTSTIGSARLHPRSYQIEEWKFVKENMVSLRHQTPHPSPFQLGHGHTNVRFHASSRTLVTLLHSLSCAMSSTSISTETGFLLSLFLDGGQIAQNFLLSIQGKVRANRTT